MRRLFLVSYLFQIRRFDGCGDGLTDADDDAVAFDLDDVVLVIVDLELLSFVGNSIDDLDLVADGDDDAR